MENGIDSGFSIKEQKRIVTEMLEAAKALSGEYRGWGKVVEDGESLLEYLNDELEKLKG